MGAFDRPDTTRLIITNYFIKFLRPFYFPFRGFVENPGDARGRCDGLILSAHKHITLSPGKDVIWCTES